MPFVDWSDPDDMLDLLLEFLADERAEAEDGDRRRFLSRLIADLDRLHGRFERIPAMERIESLRALHGSVEAAFEADPAVAHLADCVRELERIQDRAP